MQPEAQADQPPPPLAVPKKKEKKIETQMLVIRIMVTIAQIHSVARTQKPPDTQARIETERHKTMNSADRMGTFPTLW